MDRWEAKQIQRMMLTCNKNLHDYLKGQNIQNSSIDGKYKSRQASGWREALDLALRGELDIETPQPIDKTKVSKKASSSKTKNGKNANGSKSKVKKKDEFVHYNVLVNTNQRFGATILKDPENRAIVNSVTPNTPAAISGVEVGDHLVGFDGRLLLHYDDIMIFKQSLIIPYTYVFRRYGGRGAQWAWQSQN